MADCNITSRGFVLKEENENNNQCGDIETSRLNEQVDQCVNGRARFESIDSTDNQRKVLDFSLNSTPGSPQSSIDNLSHKDEDEDHVRYQPSKGRFTRCEKRLLFGIIRQDPGLFYAFLHQRKERMYGTKSWMNEIAKRYNDAASNPRSLEAIRHHLMFRRARCKGSKYEILQTHNKSCQQPDTCTKCLIFQRVCVQSQIAKCGYERCDTCDGSLPHVSKIIDFRVTETLSTSFENNNLTSARYLCQPNQRMAGISKWNIENSSQRKVNTQKDQAGSNLLAELINRMNSERKRKSEDEFQRMNNKSLAQAPTLPDGTPILQNFKPAGFGLVFPAPLPCWNGLVPSLSSQIPTLTHEKPYQRVNPLEKNNPDALVADKCLFQKTKYPRYIDLL